MIFLHTNMNIDAKFKFEKAWPRPLISVLRCVLRAQDNPPPICLYVVVQNYQAYDAGDDAEDRTTQVIVVRAR